MIIAFGSTGPKHLSLMEKEKQFAMAKIDAQDTTDVNYGLINYADIAGVYSGLGEFTNYDDVKEAIQNMPWAGEGTGLKDALSKAVSEFKRNGRPDAYKVFLVFITGAASENQDGLKQVARELLDLNVRIVSVVVGDDANDGQITSIVVGPKDVVKVKPDEEPKTVGERIENTIKRGNAVHLLVFPVY